MRKGLLLVALALVVGCGSDGPTEPTAYSAAGYWTLATVNGQPLPYSWTTDDGWTYVIQSLTLRLSVGGGGDCEARTQTVRNNLPVSGRDTGGANWTQVRDSVEVWSWVSGSGVVKQGELRITDGDGFVYVFR